MQTGQRLVLMTASVIHLITRTLSQRRRKRKQSLPITENMPTHTGRNIIARIRLANTTMKRIKIGSWCFSRRQRRRCYRHCLNALRVKNRNICVVLLLRLLRRSDITLRRWGWDRRDRFSGWLRWLNSLVNFQNDGERRRRLCYRWVGQRLACLWNIEGGNVNGRWRERWDDRKHFKSNGWRYFWGSWTRAFTWKTCVSLQNHSSTWLLTCWVWQCI